MSDKSNIEWTEATWNPVTGCSKVSEGCRHCYAKYGQWPRLSGNPKTVYFGRKFEDVQCHPGRLTIPLKKKKPTTYFVNSMSDMFHEDIDFYFIDDVIATVSVTQRHTYKLLTKRPKRMLEYFSAGEWPLQNLWLGVSVENQKTADERIPILLQTPAAVRWISAEPLLSPINLNPIHESNKTDGTHTDGSTKLDWVVVGGESGPKARPCAAEWIENIVDQCKAASIPVFVKQLGSFSVSTDRVNEKGEWVWRRSLLSKKGNNILEFPNELQIREYPI